MKPAIFLDKDGTLIPDIPYNVNPGLITLYPGVEHLALLQNMGYLIIIISNQAGMAKGLFNKKKITLVQNKIKKLLLNHNIHLDAFYYCPHHPDGIIEAFSIVCNCRKPLPGMLYKAANDLKIDLNKSWMIGDILNDVEAGNRAGCKTILINNGNETEWEINKWRKPNFETINLKEALVHIINSTVENMNNQWASCKNILCIRPDNMGDLLMSSPAIKAIKDTFNAKITVLISSTTKDIVQHIPCIDDTIVYDFPWVKKRNISGTGEFNKTIEEIKNRKFDGAIIFTVYSQNPLPSVMIAYLAGIPLRLSYCRENPYELLTDWVPDKEPFTQIRHQVNRDLLLVETIGAYANNKKLQLTVPNAAWLMLEKKLSTLNIDLTEQYIIIHAGVSETKREYDKKNWVNAAKKIINKTGCQVLFTGSKSEYELTDWLAKETGKDAFTLGGLLTFTEFLLLIKHVPLVISVNTVTIHIAAALNTPVIVLYAFTNPQHFPWQATGKILVYDVQKLNRSKNEIIKYVADNIHPTLPNEIMPKSIVDAAYDILINKTINIILEMPVLKNANL